MYFYFSCSHFLSLMVSKSNEVIYLNFSSMNAYSVKGFSSLSSLNYFRLLTEVGTDFYSRTFVYVLIFSFNFFKSSERISHSALKGRDSFFFNSGSLFGGNCKKFFCSGLIYVLFVFVSV